MRVERSITLGRPPHVVWDFLDAPATLPRWQGGVVAARRDGPPGPGTREIHVRRVLGRGVRAVRTITEYAPPSRVAMRADAPPLPFTFVSTLEPLDGGTRLTLALEATPGGALAWFAPLLARMLGRQLGTDLARLRLVLEREEDPEVAAG